jgi:hypothetical protein
MLAELKLLKLMQEDLNRRTRELDEAVRSGRKSAEDARGEYGRLSEEQGRLAEMLLRLLNDQAPSPDEPAHP